MSDEIFVESEHTDIKVDTNAAPDIEIGNLGTPSLSKTEIKCNMKYIIALGVLIGGLVWHI